MVNPRFTVEQEYNALRTELSEGKKYVFERPLLIFTIAFTIFQFNKEPGIYFSVVINILLYFNFWFTVNRMNSMARIIAYIQIVLEDKSVNWYGWETSLRNYRKWQIKHNQKIRNINIQKNAIYDNIGFYPKIFYLHIIISLIVTVGLIYYTITNLDFLNILYDSFTLAFEIIFIIYAIYERPSKLRPQIEQSRKVWKNVFKEWDELKKFSTSNI